MMWVLRRLFSVTVVASVLVGMGLLVGSGAPAQETETDASKEKSAPEKSTVVSEVGAADKGQAKPASGGLEPVAANPTPVGGGAVAGGAQQPSDANAIKSLQNALNQTTPKAVQSVIDRVNRSGKSKVGFTGFVRKSLLRALQERSNAKLASLPALTATNSQDVINALTEEQFLIIARDTVKRLSGLTPPQDLKAQIVRQNARASAVPGLGAGLPRLLLLKTPTPDLDTFNWTEKGWVFPDDGAVTGAQNQNLPIPCGGCWAFASIGTLEAAYLITNNKLIGGSEQFLLDCFSATEGNLYGLPWDCGGYPGGGGWWAFDIMSTKPGGLAATPGVPRRSDLGFSGPPANGACASLPALQKPYTVTDWGYVSQGQNPNEIPSDSDLKKFLCDYGPLAVAVYAEAEKPTWYAYKDGIISDVPNNPSAPVSPNHAIMLVGWDNSKQAWLIKNYWGDDWGIQGFAYIQYGFNSIGWGAAWVTVAP